MDIINDILTFWTPDNEYHYFWFDKTPDEYIRSTYSKIHDELKNITSDLYIELSQTLKGKLTIIIVLDQFTRNLYRDTSEMYANDDIAFSIAKELIDNNDDIQFTLSQRMFLLMPYRHQKKSQYLDIICKKIKEYEIDFPNSKLLNKFKLSTFQGYTNLTDNIILNNAINNEFMISNHQNVINSICSNYNDILLLDKTKSIIYTITKTKLYKIIFKYFSDRFSLDNRIIGISLSGGVDSMVLLFLTKIMELTNDIKKVYAMHIEHANRNKSCEETIMISNYCSMLDIPLYVRKIDYMSRSSVDRKFYEDETKKIRFNTYEYLIKELNIQGFCLGHHYGDLSENVLMNILSGRDILDLYVMNNDMYINNVRIFRPLLDNPKSDIYYIAHLYQIPYLKDATPEWSCRGIIRNNIIPTIQKQWGVGVLDNLANIGKKSKECDNIIDEFILKPMYKSITIHKYGSIFSIKQEYSNLSTVLWTKIFLKLFHNMNVNMISHKNLECFIEKFNYYKKNDQQFAFSNGTIGIFSDNKLYVFSQKFINLMKEYDLSNFVIKSSIIDNYYIKKITYDDLINGEYSYMSNMSNMSNIFITSKFNEKDNVKKIFSKINYFKDSIPKITGRVDKCFTQINVLF